VLAKNFFYKAATMAYGTRLSQMQKEMDLMSCQIGEFAKVKTQVEELRSQMMALNASMTSIASNVSTLLKDKVSGSD
jgi:prefoldin subunit 5